MKRAKCRENRRVYQARMWKNSFRAELDRLGDLHPPNIDVDVSFKTHETRFITYHFNSGSTLFFESHGIVL